MDLTATVPGCATCIQLETAGRDPTLRLTLGSLYLSLLIQHHIEVHDAAGVHVDGCPECDWWAAGAWGIASHLSEIWSRQHFVLHQLGLVWDGASHPLRFADMPPIAEPQRWGAVRP